MSGRLYIVVYGEPGDGRTLLAEELVAGLAQSGLPIGRCVPNRDPYTRACAVDMSPERTDVRQDLIVELAPLIMVAEGEPLTKAEFVKMIIRDQT